MSISSKYLMHTSMPKMSPIPTQRWWVGCSCRSACKRFKWWSWTDMMDGKQYQYQCPRNYKRNFIALEQQDRWWSDQQILGTLHSCRRHQDAGRDESQPAIAGYEKFCEMATLPHAYCGERWALFYFCIHPPFLLASSIFFSSAQIYFWGSISPLKNVSMQYTVVVEW